MRPLGFEFNWEVSMYNGYIGAKTKVEGFRFLGKVKRISEIVS